MRHHVTPNAEILWASFSQNGNDQRLPCRRRYPSKFVRDFLAQRISSQPNELNDERHA